MIKFYDTNALLLKGNDIFNEFFAISSISLTELEYIKNSSDRDSEIKYNARKLLHLLDENMGKYDIHIFSSNMLEPMEHKSIPVNNDIKILATALDYDNKVHPDDVTFVTNDLSLKVIANLFFGEDSIESVKINNSSYTGYKTIQLNNDDLVEFYSNMTVNKYDLLVNEYLLIEDETNAIVDSYKWTGEKLIQVPYCTFDSKMFGKIKPKDEYQKIAMDSMRTNPVTLIGGPAGSGKTFISLGYLFMQLEKCKLDKIIIFVNPVGARNCAKLGFYPGTVLEKVMSTQAGHVLASKLGDISEVERLIANNQLEIIPATDARGYQVPDSCGVYILESQNLTVDTLRMLLQRIGQNSQVIIDGDREEQLDLEIYQQNNGMRKVVEVFKGSSIYGQSDLKTIYRSQIASLADKMR